MRKIDLIVVHCTATIEGRDHDVSEVAKWHKAQGWRDIGYHYLIKLDGLVQHGRDEKQAGAHAQGHNANSIGVVYVGGLGKDGKPKDTRTEEQKAALLCKLHELRRKYPGARIVGHRDLSPDKNGDGVITSEEWLKACPCFDAVGEYAEV